MSSRVAGDDLDNRGEWDWNGEQECSRWCLRVYFSAGWENRAGRGKKDMRVDLCIGHRKK